MLAMKHRDVRIIAKKTLGDFIGRYTDEIGPVKPFGKNKKAVLASLKIQLGDVLLPILTVDRVTIFVRERRRTGAGGVTIGIDLTYLASVLKTAKNLWRLPGDPAVTAGARENMQYLGLSTKLKKRERRPTKQCEAAPTHTDARSDPFRNSYRNALRGNNFAEIDLPER